MFCFIVGAPGASKPRRRQANPRLPLCSASFRVLTGSRNHTEATRTTGRHCVSLIAMRGQVDIRPQGNHNHKLRKLVHAFRLRSNESCANLDGGRHSSPCGNNRRGVAIHSHDQARRGTCPTLGGSRWRKVFTQKKRGAGRLLNHWNPGTELNRCGFHGL